MGLSIIDKLKLLAKLNTAANAVQEGMKMKDSTKVILAVLGCIMGILQIPSIQAAVIAAIAAHPTIALIITGLTPILTTLHVPSNQSGGSQGSGGSLTPLILLALALGLCAPAHIRAQSLAVPPADGNNIYGAGASYSINASPSVAGSLLYAREMLPDSGTWAFTNADFLPNTLKPFTVTNNVGGGVAQKLLTIGNAPVFCITGAGVSWTGTNTGFQYNGGCLAAFKVKQILIMPAVRFLKSSVSNGTGYQPILGVYIGKRW